MDFHSRKIGQVVFIALPASTDCDDWTSTFSV